MDRLAASAPRVRWLMGAALMGVPAAFFVLMASADARAWLLVVAFAAAAVALACQTRRRLSLENDVLRWRPPIGRVRSWPVSSIHCVTAYGRSFGWFGPHRLRGGTGALRRTVPGKPGLLRVHAEADPPSHRNDLYVDEFDAETVTAILARLDGRGIWVGGPGAEAVFRTAKPVAPH